MAVTPPAPMPGPTPTPPPGKSPKDVEIGKMAAFLGYLVRGRRRPGEVTVVSHSDLFYWWPVWFIGFIMSAITYFHGVHGGFIAGHPEVVKVTGEIKDAKNKTEQVTDRPAIITDNTTHPFPTNNLGGTDDPNWPYTHNSRNLGAIFVVTLLL